MPESLRYLLLQVRRPDDPMREHEVHSFARSLATSAERIHVLDLMTMTPPHALLDRVDCVLLGGSGDYSVARGGPWLSAALECMRDLHATGKPTFASCWGFQAMARAMGGTVVTDLTRAEVGTLDVTLTPAALDDPIFGPLADANGRLRVQLGHEDIVDALPTDAIRLASSPKVTNEAFRFAGLPIYCTQFHPELDRSGLLVRLRQYPTYVKKITGLPLEAFERTQCHDTPRANELLRRFVREVFGR